MTDSERDNAEHNPLAIVSVSCGGTGFLLLLVAGWLYPRFPPPSEKYVIGAGFLLSLLAIFTGAIAIEGRLLYRVIGIVLGVFCLLGWGMTYFGAYL